MAVLITLLVVGLVVVYLRSNRKVRQRWLQQLDLPGQWESRNTDGTLRLSGGLNAGDFEWRTETGVKQGRWQYRGHSLILIDGEEQDFAVELFQPGVISLTDAGGNAELFHKQSTNVVQLGKR